MAKIVVTGATGLLGRAVHKELRSNPDHDVVGLSYMRYTKGLRKTDLTSTLQVEELFDEEAPEFVVHCAAERRPDVSEKDPEAATLLNVDATRLLAEACKACGAWLIYISTDYVFDGSQPPYFPDSNTNPLNHYGATKLAGEKAVQAALNDYLILRIPVLFGQIEKLSESAVTSIAKVLQNPQPQSIDNWAVRYPTDTTDTAGVIAQIIEYKQMSDISGVYHWSGNEALTKYDMALVMAKTWSIDPSFLTPDSNEPAGAPRPKNCQLDTSKLEAIGIQRRTYFRNGIRKAIKPFFEATDV